MWLRLFILIFLFHFFSLSAQKKDKDPFAGPVKKEQSRSKKQTDNSFVKVSKQNRKKSSKKRNKRTQTSQGDFLPDVFKSSAIQRNTSQKQSPFAVKERTPLLKFRKKQKEKQSASAFSTKEKEPLIKLRKKKQENYGNAFGYKVKEPLIKIKGKNKETSAFAYTEREPLIRLRKKKQTDRYGKDAFAQKVENSKGWERLKKRNKKGKVISDGFGDAFATSVFVSEVSYESDAFSKKVRGESRWGKMKKKNKKDATYDGLGSGFGAENISYQTDVDTDIFGGKRKKRTKKHFKGEKPMIFVKKPKTPKKKKSESEFTLSPRDKKKDLKERRRKSNEMNLFQKGVLPK
jgi:hypothetical protein